MQNRNLQVDHTFVTYLVTVWITYYLKQTLCQLCTLELQWMITDCTFTHKHDSLLKVTALHPCSWNFLEFILLRGIFLCFTNASNQASYFE